VRENLIVFPYEQCISWIDVSLAFWRYSQVKVDVGVWDKYAKIQQRNRCFGYASSRLYQHTFTRDEVIMLP